MHQSQQPQQLPQAHQQFYDDYVARVSSQYPETSGRIHVRERLHPNLFSSSVLDLPLRLKTQAEDIVKAFFELRQNPTWQSRVDHHEPRISDPGNFSALMSYDFHVDQAGNLRLIEINTNASMSLLVDLLTETQLERAPTQTEKDKIRNPFCEDFRSEIIEAFFSESQLAVQRSPRKVAIVDSRPSQQKMFIEFEMYAELFRKHGAEVQISDPAETVSYDGTDLIYNRHTDFFLMTEETRSLQAQMENKSSCLTPHPHEYKLLADKERLLELSKPNAFDQLNLSSLSESTIKRALIRTVSVADFESPETLWKERKKWFFKPMRSFGSRATYRGSSVTKQTFATIVSGPGAKEYLAQEYVPAPVVKLATPDGEKEFKYDLRFFVYRDKIQLACARTYQGQVTNSQTPGGGISIIRWN